MTPEFQLVENQFWLSLWHTFGNLPLYVWFIGSIAVAAVVLSFVEFALPRPQARMAIALAWVMGLTTGAIASPYDADPPPLSAPTMPPIQVDEDVTEPVMMARVPYGHTHTCANGHTWDHTANPGHTCQICGVQQWEQDASPRPVTVVTLRQKTRTKTKSYSTCPDPPPLASSPQVIPAVLTTTSSSSGTLNSSYSFSQFSSAGGGCANGSCSSGGFSLRPNNGGVFGFGVFNGSGLFCRRNR